MQTVSVKDREMFQARRNRQDAWERVMANPDCVEAGRAFCVASAAEVAVARKWNEA